MSFPPISHDRLAASLANLAPGTESPDPAERCVPAIAVPMHLSLDSACYGVTNATGKAALLKLMEADALGTVVFDSAVAASRQAADLGVAPALLGGDAENAALLYEALPAEIWTPLLRPRLDDQAVLEAVLAAKKVFHGGAKLDVTRSPFETVALYLAAARDLDQGAQVVTGNAALRKLMPWIDRIAEGFAAAGFDQTPTHGENALSNIFLSDGGAVRLVDFDRAVNADPLYDLAGFCLELCADDEDVRRVVRLYCGADDAGVLARVRLYMMVDDFVWGLWALVQHYRTGRGDAVEFYKYAHKRFLRCAFWRMRQDISENLRRL